MLLILLSFNFNIVQKQHRISIREIIWKVVGNVLESSCTEIFDNLLKNNYGKICFLEQFKLNRLNFSFFHICFSQIFGLSIFLNIIASSERSLNECIKFPYIPQPPIFFSFWLKP